MIISGGFGNKVCDAIYIIYMQKINGGEINVYIKRSKHEKEG
jgi:hypothetical protein